MYKLSLVSGEVQAARNNKQSTVAQADVVPGDLIHVQPGRVFCDMVVVCAENLVVDESDLTGEATPVTKTAVNPIHQGGEIYDRMVHKRHTILAGTTVMEAEDVMAVVIATSSFSTRGTLIREIYAHKHYLFKFDIEIPLILFMLGAYATLGFSIALYLSRDGPVYGWFYGM
jgi:P-type E1-E2 ATPase